MTRGRIRCGSVPGEIIRAAHPDGTAISLSFGPDLPSKTV
jgi:hypothetical protein